VDAPAQRSRSWISGAKSAAEHAPAHPCGCVCEELSRLATQPLDCEALVFTSAEGQPVRATTLRQRYWTPATDAAGVAPLRIHDLRHTAVSLWIAERANPKHIAVSAGHTSVSVVLDRYGLLYPQQVDDLMQRLEQRADRTGLGDRPSSPRS
jgi:integrase